VTNENSVLEEAMDNLREAVQRIRATQNLMDARGMTEDVHYRELLVRLSTALAMTEAALMWRPRGGVASRHFGEWEAHRGTSALVWRQSTFCSILVADI
jgi:hypothetical protein